MKVLAGKAGIKKERARDGVGRPTNRSQTTGESLAWNGAVTGTAWLGVSFGLEGDEGE